jgi:hypothetical protein
MKNIIKKWLGIDKIDIRIEQIQGTIYDRDSMDLGFAVPKFMEKKTILFAGKQKKVN